MEDGLRLNDDLRNATNQHLVDCQSCNQEFSLMKELNTMADEFEFEIPADFSDKVMAGIAQEKQEVKEMVPKWLLPVLGVLLFSSIILMSVIEIGYSTVFENLSLEVNAFYEEWILAVFESMSLDLSLDSLSSYSSEFIAFSELSPSIYAMLVCAVLSILIIYQLNRHNV